MPDESASRVSPRRSAKPGRIAVLAGLLSVPAVASAGEPASQVTQARATIDFPLSIASNQDVVLASIMLRASGATLSGTTVVRRDTNWVRSAELTRASFQIAGRIDLTVSVAIPAQIDLTNTNGSRELIAKTVTRVGRAWPQSQETLDERGLLRLDIVSRVVVGPVLVSGDYRGVLVATAQYN